MEYINHFHSVLRWILLVIIVVAIVQSLIGMMNKKAFTNLDAKIGLFLMIVCDIQLFLGLLLYILGPLGIKNIQNIGMKEIMGNSYSRFFAIEHITGMIIAIILIHVGRAKSKNASTDLAKHKSSFTYYLIALLIILATIPWPFRAGFEAIGWM